MPDLQHPEPQEAAPDDIEALIEKIFAVSVRPPGLQCASAKGPVALAAVVAAQIVTRWKLKPQDLCKTA